MRRNPILTAIMVLVLTASMAHADAIGDAGSGGDAGDTPQTALTLPGPGVYEGSLSVGDADWYELPLQQGNPVCVQAHVWGLAASDVMLTMKGDADASVDGRLAPTDDLWIGLAAIASDASLFGLEPIDDTLSAGDYSFELEALKRSDMGPGDGGSGGDAGSTADTALPVPGPCFSGKIGGNDDGDAYTFTPELGTTVTLTAASEQPDDLIIEVIGPSGEVMATLGGGSLSFTVDVDGDHTILIDSTSTQSSGYSIGLSGPDPCKPDC